MALTVTGRYRDGDMKRGRALIIKLVVLLLLGAVVNVAVAWGCALASEPELWIFTHPDDWTGDPPDAATDAWVQQNLELIRPNSTVRQLRDFGCKTRSVGLDISQDAEWLGTEQARKYFQVYALWPSAHSVHAGWPLHALKGDAWYHTTAWKERTGLDTFQARFVLHVGSTFMSLDLEVDRLLPIQPIALGFIVNTVSYAISLWALWVTPGAIRRSIHQRTARELLTLASITFIPVYGLATITLVLIGQAALDSPFLWYSAGAPPLYATYCGFTGAFAHRLSGRFLVTSGLLIHLLAAPAIWFSPLHLGALMLPLAYLWIRVARAARLAMPASNTEQQYGDRA